MYAPLPTQSLFYLSHTPLAISKPNLPQPLFKEGQKFYYVPYTPSDDHITPEPHWIVRVRYDVPTETMRYQLRNEKGSHLQWMGEHSLETLEEEGG